MKKNSILLFLIIQITVSTSVFGQGKPVQITHGKFLINGNPLGGGTAEMQSEIFASTSFFRNGTSFAPFTICQDYECKPGTTFTVPKNWALISDEQHRYGTFTIGGITYQNAHFSGGMNLSKETFLIPQIARKKGLMFFTKPFTLSGNISVCSVNDFATGCPADKILFNGQIYGHGTVRVTLRIKTVDFNDRFQTYLNVESLEYRFVQ